MKPNPFADFDLAKMMGELKMPGVDANAMMRAGRKNMEALVTAQQLAAEGFQTVARRQAEIVREAVESATAAIRESATTVSPEARTLRQTEAVKKAFERAFANMRELSELVQKSQADALNVINKRVSESFDEMREAIEKPRNGR